MSLDFAGRIFPGADSWPKFTGHVPDKGCPVPRNTEGGQRDRQGHTPIGGVPLSRPSIPHCFGSGESEASHGLNIRLATTDAFRSRSQRTPAAGPPLTPCDAGSRSRRLSLAAEFSDSSFP